MEIRAPEDQLEWDEYFDLRYRVLREPLGKERGSERNEGDTKGKHLALFVNGKIEAIARLDQAEPGISQVRFVAVDETAQGKGYGRIIMQEAEEISKLDGNHKMILHARDYAVDFYLKMNYKLIEKSHLLFGVLQHFLMEKEY